jgi:hypothetical protein
MFLLSAASKEGHLAPRTGFFHNFQKKEVLVRQYNQSEEDISDSGNTSVYPVCVPILKYFLCISS